MWQLIVIEGSTSDGTAIRRYRTVHGDEQAAATELESLAAHVARDSLGDLRVRELLGRYLHANHDPHSPASDRDQAIVDQLVDHAIGDDLAAFVTVADITSIVRHAHRHGGVERARLTLGLIRDAYRWARRQGWTVHDPTAGVTFRARAPPQELTAAVTDCVSSGAGSQGPVGTRPGSGPCGCGWFLPILIAAMGVHERENVRVVVGAYVEDEAPARGDHDTCRPDLDVCLDGLVGLYRPRVGVGVHWLPRCGRYGVEGAM